MISIHYCKRNGMKIALFLYRERRCRGDIENSLLNKNSENSMINQKNTKGSWNQFSEKVNLAIDFLVKNSKRPISSKDVARYVGMHRSSFCRLFKKELGVTPTAYLNLMRINSSKEFLASSNITVEKIAKKVGFPNPRHFRGLFRRYVGESPKEFRKKSAQPQESTLPQVNSDKYYITPNH